MLTFAALCPHPPLSIPAIGQNNLNKLATTINSLQKMNDKLLMLKPETLVIISPHSSQPKEKFSFNAAPKSVGALENFGDLATKLELTADLELLALVQENLKKNKADNELELVSEEQIDYGVTIPLFYLAQDLIGLKTLVIHPKKDYDLRAHYDFGKILQKTLKATDKKIAVIASGDLSHKISASSPAGISPRAKELDHSLIKFIKNKKISDIISIDQTLSEEAEECALRPLAILLGLLHRTAYLPQVLSYEHPFGIGYLALELTLKT